MAHFINGKWITGTGSSFASHDPATGKVVWEGNEARKFEVDQAVSAAKNAFSDWSQQEVSTRIPYLEAFRDQLQKEKQSLAEAISRETGKPLWDSASEVTGMINKIAISIEAYQVRCPTVQKGTSAIRHRPHGVMAVFGPFNFPGHLPNGHIIPALLAGNTVVFKPSELTPLVAELTLKFWEASGLPNGVINLVQGGKDTGIFLSEHPAIDGLLFTGSWQTGRHLAELMAKTPDKILALEMGGNNPLVIGTVSQLDAASYLTIQSAFLSSGQRCTCARRLIVLEGAKGDAFLNTLISMIRSIKVGAYTEVPEPFMGPVVSPQAAKRLLEAQEKLVSMGAVPLIPLSQSDKGAAFLLPGLLDVTAAEQRSDEEHFGPLLQVVRVSGFAEAIEEANRTRYGLIAGILSDDREEYLEFYKKVKAGLINWNMPLTGASSAAPFGGIGRSGNNRPSAFYAADYCAYPVASLEVDSLQMPSAVSPGIKITG